MSTSSKVGSPIVITERELAERLRQELTVTDWRAVIALVVVAPRFEHAAERACEQAMEHDELMESDVIRWIARQDEIGREQLAAINQTRDQLLKGKRLIWLRASSAADVRFLRKTAPDLASSIDLFVELQPPQKSKHDWSTCCEQLRALMERRHGVLDFTGLLPASAEHRAIPLADLYQPLVDPSERIVMHKATTAPGLLLLGHPGTGKTTFVRHLAWTYARGTHDPLSVGSKVPLLLSLSDYGFDREHDRVRSLVDFLPNWLEQQGIESPSSLAEHLSDVLLLLDGLDEIRAPQARHSVLAEVSQLLRDGRVGGAVVTGRSFLADELGQDHVLHLVSTREPTQDQTRHFLTRFVELRGGDEIDAESLVSRIERDADLRALARTPLMLAFMAILDEIEGRLPDRRIEIYYRLGEMLVDRWTRARSIGTSLHRRERPTRADALRVLGPLAWWTVEQGGGVVPEDLLSQEIERIEARREGPTEAKDRATALLDLLRSDTALLIPHPGRRWSFVHSSVGEYFAGIEVERDRKRWNEVLADPFRPEWREIVLFSAGQLGVIEGRMESLDELVQAILTASHASSRDDGNQPSLLIGLLDDSPGLSRRQIDGLVERLVYLVLAPAKYSPASEQTQRDFIAFLPRARGHIAAALGETLRGWFSDRPHEILWNRIFFGAGLDTEDLEIFSSLLSRIADLADVVLGPLIASLGDDWVRAHGIDLEPTLARWREEHAWAFRFAAWFIQSDAAARQRPYDEVVAELGLQ